MKLHEYWLGLHPLDWEFCFMPVQTYKNFITEQYHKNPTFYNISAGSIEKVLAHIDVILLQAKEGQCRCADAAGDGGLSGRGRTAGVPPDVHAGADDRPTPRRANRPEMERPQCKR